MINNFKMKQLIVFGNFSFLPTKLISIQLHKALVEFFAKKGLDMILKTFNSVLN